MFEWFKKLSREKSAANIKAALKDLIFAADCAYASMLENGAATPRQLKFVTDAQKKLLFELAGPLPLSEVMDTIIIPRMKNGLPSEGAITAIKHVIDTAEGHMVD